MPIESIKSNQIPINSIDFRLDGNHKCQMSMDFLHFFQKLIEIDLQSIKNAENSTTKTQFIHANKNFICTKIFVYIQYLQIVYTIIENI